jgi:hypothetical protein
VARTAHAGHGCYGQTDNPHWSGHNPGAITVRSRTVCYGHAVGVAVNLYRWIFGAWYFRDGASASGWERVNANATQDNAGCGWWRGEAGHSATNHYPSNTSNQAYLC